jgi:hypothetical protein
VAAELLSGGGTAQSAAELLSRRRAGAAGPGAAVPGQRLRVTAHVLDAGGAEVGATAFTATVTAAALQVRGTFPGEPRRGGPYREFDVVVRNLAAAAFPGPRSGRPARPAGW